MADGPANDPDVDPNDNPVTRFVSGKAFKIVCMVLIAGGIIYGIAAGTLTSSRVPSAGSGVQRFDTTPRPAPQRTAPVRNPTTDRFRAVQERNSR